MTITLTGTGGWATRTGKMGGGLDEVNTYRGTTGPTRANSIEAQFQSTNQQLVDDLYRALKTNLATQQKATATYIKNLMDATLKKMVKDDVVLNDTSTYGAMKELIRQITATSDSVEKPTVSVSVAAGGTNTGTGQCIASITNKYGVTSDYVYNETILATCTDDSQQASSPTTAGEETFNFVGDLAVSDKLSSDWPAGSGCDEDVSVLVATDTANTSATTQGNILTNSDWELWTGTNPDNWTVVSAASKVDKVSTPYRGTYALKFIGNGAENTLVRQTLNTAGQTLGKVYPNQILGINFWTRVSAAAAAGVVAVSLVDGSNAVINDDAGTANTISVDLTTETTTYAAHNGFFRLPKLIPTSGVKLQIRLSTALENGKDMYLDDLIVTPAKTLYDAGVHVAMFRGNTDFIVTDYFTITVSNNYASKWQKGLHRCFDMPALGLFMPSVSGGAETIADTLWA